MGKIRTTKMMLAMLLIMAVLGTAACSSSKGSGKTASETNGASDAGESPLVVLADGAINLGTGSGDEVVERRKKDMLTTEYGNDGKFQYEWTSSINEEMKKQGIALKYEDWGWAEPLIQKQSTAILSGQGPDIMIGETQSPGFAAQGVFEPFPEWLDQEIRENIVDGAWKPMEVDGKIYGVAVQPGVSNLYWNKELFRQAGLDPEKPPVTWTEWTQMSKQIAEAGKGKFFAGGAYAGPNFGGVLRFGSLLMVSGGGFVDEANKAAFNQPGNTAAFELIRELGKYNSKGALVSNAEAPFWDGFQKGQLAFAVDGPWRAQICKDLEMDCGIAPLPIPEGGKIGNLTIGAAFLSVPTYSKNKEDAFKYIQAAISPASQEIVKTFNIRPVIRKDIGESDGYRAEHPELYQVYQGLRENVQGLPTFDKASSKVWQAFQEAMAKTFMTDEPIDKLLDEAQEKAEKLTR
ncbi:extracellular solute-binding protein [Paenibacillus sp. PL91]|uniref:extracellular solute-binding protein n=1 Tax=Paenibacillus sp. PL91 TaxID=2729538 RepID=UPI00145CAC28|nr:extracellular solute-binding protein [Paenibacillus sp. PL91]MBC9200398.1 extracellular solute-binding protein [Paenibacillus sp. PL91]